MVLTAPGLPPVAQMLPGYKPPPQGTVLGKRKQAASTCSRCGGVGHTSRSKTCPLYTDTTLFDTIVPGAPTIRLKDLNWEDHYFARLLDVMAVCPTLLAIVKSVTPCFAPSGAYDDCMLIAPYEDGVVLDDDRLATLEKEAVKELVAEAYPADEGFQVITGISEVGHGDKLTRCWVRHSSLERCYTEDNYVKDGTRVRFFILGAQDPRVRRLPKAIETGVTDLVLGSADSANLNPGGATGGKVRDTTDFGIVYTNMYKGTRERKRPKRQKPSTCTRCKTAGKPEEVFTGHTSRSATCPSL